MSSYRSTGGRRRGAGADGRPESNDAVAGQRQPQSPRQQGSFEDLTGTGTANPAPRCGGVTLRVELQGLDDGACGPTGTIEVYQPDKSVMASRLSAYAFAIPGLEALSPSPPKRQLDSGKVLRLAGMRDSASCQAFYAQYEVDVPGAKARCCSLAGALELIKGFWRGKKSTDLAAVTAWLVGALRALEADPAAEAPAACRRVAAREEGRMSGEAGGWGGDERPAWQHRLARARAGAGGSAGVEWRSGRFR